MSLGQIQDFKIEGAQKMCSAHYEREAWSPFNSAGVHTVGPEVEGTVSSKVSDALSYYLRPILKHSDTKLN